MSNKHISSCRTLTSFQLLSISTRYTVKTHKLDTCPWCGSTPITWRLPLFAQVQCCPTLYMPWRVWLVCPSDDAAWDLQDGKAHDVDLIYLVPTSRADLLASSAINPILNIPWRSRFVDHEQRTALSLSDNGENLALCTPLTVEVES